MKVSHSTLLSILTLALALSCKPVNAKVGTVNSNGNGSTQVDNAEVGQVNANVGLEALLGSPYVIVKTAAAVDCATGPDCQCQLKILKRSLSNLIEPTVTNYFVAKMDASRTTFGCYMNSLKVNDVSSASMSILSRSGILVPATPLGTAKTLPELQSIIH